MDNQRLILFIALSFVVLLMWEAWQKDYAPAPVASTETAAVSPGAGGIASPDIPAMSASPAMPGADAPVTPDGAVLKSVQAVHVVTDVLDLEINTVGGDIRRADLREYPVSAEEGADTFRLMSDRLPLLFVAQSGLLNSAGKAPNHHAVFSVEKSEYRLAEGEDVLRVTLRWQDEGGVGVDKIYTFRRGDYLVNVEHRIDNQSVSDWQGSQYRQLQRNEGDKDKGSSFIYTYTGGVIYSPEEKYEKISFDDMQDGNLSRDISDGWAAMIQHYFLAAWLPESGEKNHYYSKTIDGGRYVLGMVGPQRSVAAGSSAGFVSELYLGPKLQHRLEEVAPGLELTVDYGMLTVLAKPLFWLLEKIYSFVGNWGWAIALLTLLIKLVFYKLSETSYRSMANMRKLAPRMQSLKERYGDDKQKLQQAMMEMYKTEKINPLGGCLPILVQIPVFIALYWMLLESVEMRQAPFIFWLNDLSAADPYFVLPLIMGVTMLIQQKLNPAPMDPVQAKVMMVLPVVFTVFFAFFPSGLVWYWVVNNTLSIAQQWMITRRVEAGKE